MIARLIRIAICSVVGSLVCDALFCGSLVGGPRAAAAQAIPAALLADLKGATVFVKVNRRTLDWSGSGFVIQKNKTGVLIVTNAHVLEPPKIDDSDISKKIPKETMKLILDLQKEVSGVESAASVVFNSGTPQEQTLPAEVLAKDVAADLAVLKVAGAPETVKPIKPNLGKIAETTPLVVFGFPFGGKLAGTKANPTITITRAELTSFKPITEDVNWLQLQGAVNPGNSGGPVVDIHGKLCGVLALGIPGSGLSFAIPTAEVTQMVQGRLATWRASAKKIEEGDYDVEYRVQLIDPMKRISDLDLRYVTGTVPRVTAAEFKASPTPLGSAKSVDLKREGLWAVGTFKIAVSGPGPLIVTVQPTWIDGTKKRVLGRPEVVRLSLGPGTPVGPEDGRTFWRYVDKKKGEGWFIKTAAGWDEEDDGALHHFAEVKRDADKIEVLDAGRKLGVRLFHERLSFKVPQNKKWINIYKGAWEATGTVIASK